MINFKPYLIKKGISERVSRFVAPTLNYANRLLSVNTLSIFSRDIICKRVTQTDERFDQLWEKYKSDFMVIGERSSEYLQWRFLSDSSGVIFAAFDKNNQKVQGYIACTIKDGFLSIQDLVSSEQSSVIKCLLRSVLRYGREMSARSINLHLLMNEAVESLLKKYGFHKKKNDRKIYVYAANVRESDQAIVADADNWLLMSGDNDT